MKALLITLILFSQLSFAGGGEGSNGGGAGIRIAKMMETASRATYQLDIPTLKIQDQKIPVIHLCLDEQEIRTFTTADDYPTYLDIDSITQGIGEEVQAIQLKKSYAIRLFKKIDINNANMRIEALSQESKVDYQIPQCTTVD